MRALSLCRGLLLLALISPAAAPPGHARDDPSPDDAAKKKVGFKDPLDGAFDLSDRILEAHGFIPVPILITEPALGGFGGGLAPVFLKRQPPLQTDGKKTPIAPDITAVAGAYTANDTWFLGAGRAASLPRHRLRYKAFAGYANLNVDFYETLPSGEEKAFEVNGRAAPVYLYLGRFLHDARFVLGTQYVFAKAKLKPAAGGDLPPSVEDKELDSTISSLGAVADFDGRDNVFTPDRGLRAHAHFDWSDDWLGSDYRYGRLNAFAYWYHPLARWSGDRNWISGLRVDMQQSFGDPPFYLVPFIDMRGVPAARYQGRTDVLMETDQRIDFTRRWSVVLFGGLGKAFDDYADFGDAKLVYGYGAGFRYLVARKFKLRMGVDLAHGPEDWAYYIVFGSAWSR